MILCFDITWPYVEYIEATYEAITMIGFIFNLGCIQGLHSICWPEGGVGMFSTNIDRIETDGS